MKKIILLPSLTVVVAALAMVLFSDWTTAEEPAVAPAPSGPDLVAVISSDPNLTTLSSALRAAELDALLHARGPFTVFAPNNAAFAKLPTGTLDTLMMPENKGKLAAILNNHVLHGRNAASDLSAGKERTLQGGKVTIARNGDTICFGPATVVVADREASNGTVHVIDAVVLPD